MLFGQRHEGDDLPTVLLYGHGDTVRAMTERWRQGLQIMAGLFWDLGEQGLPC